MQHVAGSGIARGRVGGLRWTLPWVIYACPARCHAARGTLPPGKPCMLAHCNTFTINLFSHLGKEQQEAEEPSG